VALDTCIFIYQWEGNPRYSHLTDRLFSALQESDFSAVTSTITMAELLVHPYREKDAVRANDLLGLLSTYPNLVWEPPDLAIAVRAAEIRALYRLQTPDAIQAATAIHSRATAFITNDPIFTRVPAFKTLVLDRLI
jgi:predicted nucleic acid-binding protein